MNRSAASTAVLVAAVALGSLGSWGCSSKTVHAIIPNDPPTVRLTAAPVDTIGPDGQRLKYFYAYKLNWVGYDPDGRVDHFLYAIDPQKTPPGQPIPWISTTKNEQTFFFKSAIPEVDSTGVPDPRNPLADDFHVFAIKAVDNMGAESEVVERAFFSFTQAPTVQITEPSPSHLNFGLVTPFVRISWTGTDPDGQFTQKPVKYKFKLFKEGSSDFAGDPNGFQVMQSNPDSLRRYYAPTFAGWDSTGPDSAFVTYTNLVPNSRYIFVVVAYDEAGAYSPIFSLDHNMLQLQVSFAGVSGPAINIYNEFFNYTYPGGGFPTTPEQIAGRTIRLEVGAHQPLRFNWGATATAGTVIKQYRWMLSPAILNLDDETPRTNEQTDWYHWSQWSLSNTSCQIGPFDKDTTYTWLVEAEDINGLISLGIVAFHVVVPPAVQKDLLVVNDTRLLSDQRLFFPDPSNPDSLQSPPGIWPSRAELDTLLFARGGVRWQWAENVPGAPQTMSYPGLFAGYSYDTVYTKSGPVSLNGVVVNFSNNVPLSTLVKYSHVVWICDFSGWNVANQATTGVSAQYVMSGPGAQNTLAAYATLGGKVWACGGGFIGATMMNWDNVANDRLSPSLPKFSNEVFGGRPAELVPGRFPYDLIKWQSEIWLAQAQGPIFKSARTPAAGTWAIGAQPDYSLLPARLRQKVQDEPDVYNPDGTPRYPWRDYGVYDDARVWDIEVIPGNNNISGYGEGLGANRILENISTNPDSQVIISTLDTLYIIQGGGVLPPNLDTPPYFVDEAHFNENVVMTYYHGFASAPFVFSGFSLWAPARPGIIGVVDFVLQQIWGLHRDPVDRTGAFALRPAQAGLYSPWAPRPARIARPLGAARPAVSPLRAAHATRRSPE